VLGRATGNTDTQDSPRPRLGGSHHLPPYSMLCSSPRRLHPNGYFSRDSRVGVPKSRQMGLPGLWSPITLRADLGSRCGLKQSCRSCRDLSNGMSHVLCSQVFRVDSRLLVVGSQNWQCRNPTLAKCGGEAQHLEKLEVGSLPGLPNVQSSTERGKTPRIGVFLVSLERS
jgi:hypothetical protein